MELVIPDRKLIAIEYPGIVNNIDKAFDTLGGLKQLTEIFKDISKRIKLNFRPDNPFSRPAYGDRSSRYCLLLKVRRKKNNNSNNSNNNNNSNVGCRSDTRSSLGCLEGEIVGTVETVITFTSLCDFQYLPMTQNKNGTYTSFHDDITFKDVNLRDYSQWVQKPVPLFLLPPFFSRFDQPFQYCFREKATEKQFNFPKNCIGISRSRRPHFTNLFKFSSSCVPNEPNVEAVLKVKKLLIPNWKIDRIKNAFDKHPVYTSVALMAEIGPLFTREDLKAILPTVTYYCVDGPWRAMWVRLGYNLRQHPESKIYQNLDFRQERSYSNLFTNKIKPKRNTFEHNLPTTISKTHIQQVSSFMQRQEEQQNNNTTNSDDDDDDVGCEVDNDDGGGDVAYDGGAGGGGIKRKKMK
ncbi:hypothetical protein HELRODRAFT_189301, partial [Helobdella robusta]|uniref:Transcription factor IIIC subunit 5 HTH domain-containing protein n=1 Tax=Helobdella robusta TaxID=6412 RepID=T1FQX8_HELRO